MAQDVVEQITEDNKTDRRFAIQIDEYVDVSDEAELLAYIQYFEVKKGATVEEILGCKQLPQHKEGDDIFKIPDNFVRLELDLQWECCVSASTDVATPMTGMKNGLVARIREMSPKISWQHCIIHKQSLAAKKKNTPDLRGTHVSYSMFFFFSRKSCRL